MHRLLLCLALTWPAAALADAPTRYQASYDLETALDYAGALAEIDALRAEGEDGYLVHLRRGWLLYLNGRYADAVEAYRAAIRKAPDAVEARTGVALPLMALRRWTEAEAACAEALQRAPGNYLAMSRRAYSLYSAGRYAEAVAQYRDLVQQHPSDVEMRTGLGWALFKLGRRDDARREFAAVLRTAPAHTSAQQGLDATG